MKHTPEQALKIIGDLLGRAAITELESIGVQVSYATLQAALKELSDFKNLPKPEQ